MIEADARQRPAPAAYQPQLTRWRHGWRFALALVIGGTAWATVAAREYDAGGLALLGLDAGLGTLAFVAVLWRRRWPVPIGLLTSLLGCASGLAAGASTLAAVSVATRRRYREIAVVGVANFASGLMLTRLVLPDPDADPWWFDVIVNAIFTAGMMGWGMYIGSRRELYWTLQRRAELAEAEQELQAQRARENERARIAREMHDVLAHRISQISLHAGALSFRDDLTAEQMRESATVIQQKAHEALTDLRGVLGVLRDPVTGRLDADTAVPQPTYIDLPRLVEECRHEGLNLDYADHLGEPLPDALGRTVYRIVQEGITNARKHAPDTLLTIRLGGDPARGVEVVLDNPLGFSRRPTPGAGLGLIGLAERAELAGGRLVHGVRGSHFEVRAWLPWAP
ncbi:histidine kinase [Nocardioides fonticola]|uniref:histidine kinase n=1 Tax=Nocardioides fonticola TaxID=450363 RepID=A0ABP7XI72_9ACTN